MGKPIEITRLEFSANELRELAAGMHDGAVVRRLLAIALILDGHSRAEAARLNGMDRQTLRDWVHRYNDEGVGGLSSRLSPGRPAALNGEQMEALRSMVLEGPDPERDTVVRWRCIDLRHAIAARWSVELHERSVGRLLHTGLRLARMPSWCATVPVGTNRAADCASPTTSRCCPCRPTRRNSIRWRTSGTISVATNSANGSGTAIRKLSPPAKTPGSSCSVIPSASIPSPIVPGHGSMFESAGINRLGGASTAAAVVTISEGSARHLPSMWRS